MTSHGSVGQGRTVYADGFDAEEGGKSGALSMWRIEPTIQTLHIKPLEWAVPSNLISFCQQRPQEAPVGASSGCSLALAIFHRNAPDIGLVDRNHGSLWTSFRILGPSERLKTCLIRRLLYGRLSANQPIQNDISITILNPISTLLYLRRLRVVRFA